MQSNIRWQTMVGFMMMMVGLAMLGGATMILMIEHWHPELDLLSILCIWLIQVILTISGSAMFWTNYDKPRE